MTSASRTFLVAMQELKGTLRASEACAAVRRGILRALPDATVDVAPLSDGGPGFVEALVSSVQNGEWRETVVQNALGDPVRAKWGLVAPRTAVVEMASAAGLSLLPPASLDVGRASTYGVGELLKAALDEGCTRLLLGLGGSATNDGGTGALTALGARFLDAHGTPLPPGGAALARLSRIDLSGLDPRLAHVECVLATDVLNPLLGAQGASRVFGPQKGADEATVALLDQALEQLARITFAQLGRDGGHTPRLGAAGGLAYGLAVFAGAKAQSGYELVQDVLGLEARIEAVQVVLTGEGRMDEQTAQGKGPGMLGQRAKAKGRRVVAFVGSVEEGVLSRHRAELPFDEVISLSAFSAKARTHAADVLEAAAHAWAAAR